MHRPGATHDSRRPHHVLLVGARGAAELLSRQSGFLGQRDGGGIFDLPEADLGCHLTDEEEGAITGTHNISFYCDDMEKKVAEMKSRGVEFTGSVEDHGYGLVTHFNMPGGFAVQLYQPRYPKEKREK